MPGPADARQKLQDENAETDIGLSKPQKDGLSWTFPFSDICGSHLREFWERSWDFFQKNFNNNLIKALKISIFEIKIQN